MTDVEYRIALATEWLDVTGQWFLVRCGLKQLTIQERYDLTRRTDWLRWATKELKHGR
jgi:hypothetical protein